MSALERHAATCEGATSDGLGVAATSLLEGAGGGKKCLTDGCDFFGSAPREGLCTRCHAHRKRQAASSAAAVYDAGVMALLTALAVDMAVEKHTAMYRPIPPLAIMLHSMLTSFAVVCCSLASNALVAFSFPSWRPIGKLSFNRPACVIPSHINGRDCLAVADNSGSVRFLAHNSEPVTMGFGSGSSSSGNLQSIVQLPGNRNLIALVSMLQNLVAIFDSRTQAKLGEVSTGDAKAWGLAVRPSDGRLLVGAKSGVLVIDVADPASPFILTTIDLARSCNIGTSSNYGTFGLKMMRDGKRMMGAAYSDGCVWFLDADARDGRGACVYLLDRVSPHDVVELPDGTIGVLDYGANALHIYEGPSTPLVAGRTAPLRISTIKDIPGSIGALCMHEGLVQAVVARKK